ncbi:MAG: AAA family ATPase [Agathobacter sp.]|nr:AAA family ATPase [Agathobacter sp.]
MNIKEAKQEIKNTVLAYLAKDETGDYAIPIERQRPVLLMGPPGIGKTAIMEQVARECGINLVAYTITHHTRQSAIGLPFIKEKEYEGNTYSVTEYTMSEIIAAIYEQIENSGVKEGILFLDEINCVSETLAPTMLQFLQYKTFGNHRIPEGFVIVTAGNPPEYNKSVRDFDIVTYDRVKRIDIEEDYSVWKEYAYRMGIAGSIMSYLEIKKENFYSVVSDLDGKRFVTARGWEDLSQMILMYEKLQIPVTFDLVVQYVQDEEIARGFSNYYELYHKYADTYQIPKILEGVIPQDTQNLKNAPFDEKLSLIGLIVESLNQEFKEYAFSLDKTKQLFEQLKFLREDLKNGKGAAGELLERYAETLNTMLEHEKKAGMISREEQKVKAMVIAELQEYKTLMAQKGTNDPKTDFTIIKERFDEMEAKRKETVASVSDHLTNCFAFFGAVYGESQEMVMFLSELSAGFYSIRFVQETGNEAYYKYNRLLLLKNRKEELKEEILELLSL